MKSFFYAFSNSFGLAFRPSWELSRLLGGGSVPKILPDVENYAALRLSTTPTQAFAQFVGRYPPPPRATILPAQRS